MAEIATSRLSRRDRHFTLVLIGAGTLLFGLFSMLESDRRGLLEWDGPGAFATGDVTELPNSYDIVYLGLGQSGGPAAGARPNGARPGAARFIPPRTGLAERGSAGGGQPGGPADPIAQVSTPTALVPPLPAAPGAGAQSGTGPTAFTPSNLGGGGGSPGGLIPIDPAAPPPPPVPAVPEPSAWLLMILGVGFLASALRRRGEGTGQIDRRRASGLAGQAG